MPFTATVDVKCRVCRKTVKAEGNLGTYRTGRTFVDLPDFYAARDESTCHEEFWNVHMRVKGGVRVDGDEGWQGIICGEACLLEWAKRWTQKPAGKEMFRASATLH